MVGVTTSMKFQAQWAIMKRTWADPERRRLIVRLLFGGATGVLTLAIIHEAFKGMCSTPWEAVRLVIRLITIVSSTIVGFVARGCKPKFKHWTLRFEILRAVIRECARGPHVLYVHGGGFAVMSPRLYISFAATIAVAIEKELGASTNDPVQVDVFLGNYRKAPEHCFPTPPEDTVAAYKHLLHTEGIPPEQIILVGDSAGGGLVMSTLLRMRDASSEHLPLAAVLICPAVDLSEIETHGDAEASSAHCLLSPEMIAAGRRGYHTTASDPTTWADASSVHCDLRGLPPVLVQAASLDYIYQHSVRLAQKAESDGVTNWEIDVHHDMPHVFSIFPSYV
ncbi:hypothetical protein PHMEG_00032851, partial [Phytophthora megakarya]